ncbi:MutS-related protein [uncultured Clostridium sp.]|uniref:MutS-related protein n=1 Tax=uncultured Clostridium sp. TaxID=59620 RepID=UPI00261293E0|nr:DNA mismatch repair protein MutS [uncultured Clostridium sp.]
MLKNREARMYVTNFWPEGCDKLSRDMDGIKKYYDEYTSGEYGEIDEQSFSDLNLDSIFEKMDGTYSSAGESKLYDMLRNPVRDREILEKRNTFMEHFGEYTDDRIDVQEILYQLSRDKKFNFLELLNSDYKGNEFKKYAYFILGKILPIIFLLAGIFYRHEILIVFIAVVFINSLISAKERGASLNTPYEGIYYGAALIKAGSRILKLDIDVLKPYQEKIDKAINDIGSDSSKLKIVSVSIVGGILNLPIIEDIHALIGSIILSVENAYYNLIDNLNNHKDSLKELYDVMGEIDALISVQGYKEKSEYETTKPEFIDNYGFKIVDGAHPLIKDVVKNSIYIENKGIVLTGTNMSGKSTFLRMLGINIVFAQSFNFVHASEYKAEFLNYVSSISPQDDVEAGKSYYIAEAEAVLRIINALDGEYKVFCGIDEIFRGTNPVERIAASEEILRYIQERNSLSIVATHDKELTDLLTKTHNFYHFSEKVSDSTGLSFDYEIKKGVLKTRNAIKLLKYIGYPNEIIDDSYAAIEMIEACEKRA